MSARQPTSTIGEDLHALVGGTRHETIERKSGVVQGITGTCIESDLVARQLYKKTGK
jgi:hypothetical protein